MHFHTLRLEIGLDHSITPELLEKRLQILLVHRCDSNMSEVNAP